MKKAVAILLCCVPLLWSCASNMAVSEYGSASNGKKVLIAGENTGYKQQLAAEVIRAVGTESCYFRVVGLNQLETMDAAPYQAIVLLAGYRMGRLDGRAAKYLQRDPENPKVILFVTGGNDDPRPKDEMPDVKVDSISSASLVDKVGMRADQLAALITERL